MMIESGIKPYPMVYNEQNKDLKRFQRWVIGRFYQFVPWGDYQKVNHGKTLPNHDLINDLKIA